MCTNPGVTSVVVRLSQEYKSDIYSFIFFLLVALNDLDVLSADIQNAYLTAPINENYYVQTGMEFPESLKGRPAKVVRTLYRLPVASHKIRSFLAKNLKELGYESTKGNVYVYTVWARIIKTKISRPNALRCSIGLSTSGYPRSFQKMGRSQRSLGLSSSVVFPSKRCHYYTCKLLLLEAQGSKPTNRQYK